MSKFKFQILYTASLITTEDVIPAPYQARGKLQRESRKKMDSPVSSTGQAYQARNDKPAKIYVVMYKWILKCKKGSF